MAGKVKLIGAPRIQAYRMLHTIGGIFEKADIPYILEAGTLLGVVRENRLLPWDNDLDLTVTSEFADELIKIRSKIHESGYRTRIRRYTRDTGPFKKGLPRLLKIQTTRFKFFKQYNLMDIFIKYKVGEYYYWTVDDKKPVLKKTPAEFYDQRKYHSFDGRLFQVPLKSEEYLRYHYGPDWRIPVKSWNFRLDDHCEREQL